MKLNFRMTMLVMLLISGLVLISSWYLQYTEGLQPCPLCLMQRGMTGLILVGSLIGLWMHQRCTQSILLGGVLLFAIAGIFFALRQLWLQSLPSPETGICMPGIEALIHKLPWHELLHTFFWGGRQSCGEIVSTFIGLPMAAWSFLYFSLVGILSVLLGIRLRQYE